MGLLVGIIVFTRSIQIPSSTAVGGCFLRHSTGYLSPAASRPLTSLISFGATPRRRVSSFLCGFCSRIGSNHVLSYSNAMSSRAAPVVCAIRPAKMPITLSFGAQSHGTSGMLFRLTQAVRPSAAPGSSLDHLPYRRLSTLYSYTSAAGSSGSIGTRLCSVQSAHVFVACYNIAGKMQSCGDTACHAVM